MSDPTKTVDFSSDDQSSLQPFDSSHSPLPEKIGRYRVEKLLGEGGFGCVYLAHDDDLDRPVAIKVPHPHRISRPEDVELYLTEARILASLDHPHIVPVYDVGSTPDGLCFVVSKLINGSTLAERIKQSRPSFTESAVLIATVAEALHHAHLKGLVHRDVKPPNILIDTEGKPFVTDFGLALKEEDFGKEAGQGGTPRYMSPEQARGEGHRVDGRSDIFSLGVVLYELLTGRRPFRGESLTELLLQIANVEVRPPRQIEDAIPKEIERISLKALSKRAADRYMTAKDMAEDLWLFLSENEHVPPSKTVDPSPDSQSDVSTETKRLSSGPESPRVVPKGLRSFDEQDADFFLELLPGPRDREGLPDSIRFWKTRIEERDPDRTFSVGLIYGPSGCGKSSLVKAGLLPRLSAEVVPVYVEATAEGTETGVLKRLRKGCPSLPEELGLKEALTGIRRGQGMPLGEKVLIVLDQFEQWLHAKKEQEHAELIEALRQCEGERLQCIVIVRDDFWMAVTRFLQRLEVRLVEGQNLAAVDLFPERHAQKVMTAFGRAFGALPEATDELAPEQKQFLNQSVHGLAQEGKVICAHLALFAEMMKGKEWTPSTLKEVGGTEGIGVTFLDETFSASTAPPQHRLHQKAAQAVLKALLPEGGSDIKGHMKSYDDLLQASGYAGRLQDFEDLLRILDSEIRLITPTDPQGIDAEDASTSTVEPGQKYYQLTHDYLVPSLREWLTRKQKETRRGRAELLLADRAAIWNARPESRQLPSLLQWCQIRWLTKRKNWTPPQRKMMGKASRYHALRGATVAIVLLLVGYFGWEGYGRLKAQNLRDRLLEAKTAEVSGVVEDMAPYRRWSDPLLREAHENAKASKDFRKQLHLSLALLPVDSGQVDYLYGQMLKGEPEEVLVIREALSDHRTDLSEKLWTFLENARNDQSERLRAACALAKYAPQDSRWQKVSPDVAGTLVIQKPFEIAQWTDALRGAGKWLLKPLATLLIDEKRGVSERGLIASVYGKYAPNVPGAYARLEKQLDELIKPNVSTEKKISFAKRQASLAMALMVMGRTEKVWPLLKHSPDPTLRSFLIHRLGPGGTDSKLLIDRLRGEKNRSVRQAILLSLGEYGLDRLSLSEQQQLLPQLVEWYRDDPDPGIHGATEWLLRKWLATEQTEAVQKKLATGKVEGKRQWYVTKNQGHTMVIIPRPGKFWMGEGPERQQREINYHFAIASREVTVEQFLQFRKEHQYFKPYAPTRDCPVNRLSWYEAAAYCNWLSEQEGLPKEQWCYVPREGDRYENGMKMAPNYLQRTGYRLPLESEWEYACRAGSETRYSFGEEAGLLDRYGWHSGNSVSTAHSVGLLKPNDFGLFDVHGNVDEWCQDRYDGKADEKNVIISAHRRAVRGGSFRGRELRLRSADRFFNGPSHRFYSYGFRLARTLSPDGFTPPPLTPDEDQKE